MNKQRPNCSTCGYKMNVVYWRGSGPGTPQKWYVITGFYYCKICKKMHKIK